MASVSKEIETTYILHLNEQEAKAVTTVCSLGLAHFSAAGEEILQKNGVTQSGGMGSVYEALSSLGAPELLLF